MCGLRMNERYETVDAPTGSLVDQADSAGAQILQGLRYVGTAKQRWCVPSPRRARKRAVPL